MLGERATRSPLVIRGPAHDDSRRNRRGQRRSQAAGDAGSAGPGGPAGPPAPPLRARGRCRDDSAAARAAAGGGAPMVGRTRPAGAAARGDTAGPPAERTSATGGSPGVQAPRPRAADGSVRADVGKRVARRRRGWAMRRPHLLPNLAGSAGRPGRNASPMAMRTRCLASDAYNAVGSRPRKRSSSST